MQKLIKNFNHFLNEMTDLDIDSEVNYSARVKPSANCALIHNVENNTIEFIFGAGIQDHQGSGFEDAVRDEPVEVYLFNANDGGSVRILPSGKLEMQDIEVMQKITKSSLEGSLY